MSGFTGTDLNGFIHYILNRCLFNSSDLKDIENIYSYYYNKEEFLRFSSSSGKFVGYTELGVKTAERANNDPEQMSSRRAEKETICKPNIDGDYSTILTKSVQPRVRVQSLEPSGGNHPAMLICSIYDFYPKKIKVSWLQDQEEVSSDVTSTAEMEDGDWFYQIHSYLEYTPSLELYSERLLESTVPSEYFIYPRRKIVYSRAPHQLSTVR
uniref:Ig-like domain-containing protein n=1 Tax=Oryzias sinensis TaxID=183150 RepID=A0A8C7X3A6_9TELE